MRNFRFASLVLFALPAAAAHAVIQSTAFSFNTFTYSADAGLTLNSITNDEYGSETPNVYDPTGTSLTAGSGSSLHADDGTHYSVSTTTNATLTATQDSYVDTFTGREYLFNFTNPTANDLSFSVTTFLQRSLYVNSTDPLYDSLTGVGAFAESTGYAGLENNDTGVFAYMTDDIDTINNGNPFVLQKAFAFTGTVSVLAGQTQTIEVWASSESFVEYTNEPVPEPASFAVVGLGALGLLRRRRKA